ncbi:MAG: YceH family protein [Thermodesulfobacteriota bacterium]|nr:YceH family protein [Thermodesulfobacteriota bacterium]
MDLLLNDIETRVLGALMEKEVTTPEYYPLSLNGLTAACNQKSNRSPVVSFDEETVVRAIDTLKEKRLAVPSNIGRVPKYAQNFTKSQNLIASEAAILCVLFLRGTQTIGELRGRTERMHRFAGLEAVEESLNSLTELEYVTKLPLQPGRKEHRYTHLLAGEPDMSEVAAETQPEKATLVVRAENERILALEQEMVELKAEIAELKTNFENFKGQFE